MILPDAAWRGRPGLVELAAALGPGEARYVGGAVRDTLLGLDVADIDVATRHPPETVVTLLQAAGIKAIPTGIAHGTITAVAHGTVVEVTTLRRDVETDGRHASVAFTDDWREDAARRDFTINALYAEPVEGAIFDPFGGLDDLAARRVRFIGDPLQRIAEDHLRILRFFRFLARFGDAPDPGGLEACTLRANDLMALSRERIRDELLKLLVARDAVPVLMLMEERGILRPVVPEITAEGIATLQRLAAREAEAGVAADALRRLTALVPASVLDSVAARLKLSNAGRKRLAIASDVGSVAHPHALAYRVGVEGAVDQLLIGDAPLAGIADLASWSPPTLPLSGGALVAAGLRKGPLVAATLKRIEDRWVEERFPPAERVDGIAAEEIAQALRSDSNA